MTSLPRGSAYCVSVYTVAFARLSRCDLERPVGILVVETPSVEECCCNSSEQSTWSGTALLYRDDQLESSAVTVFCSNARARCGRRECTSGGLMESSEIDIVSSIIMSIR